MTSVMFTVSLSGDLSPADDFVAITSGVTEKKRPPALQYMNTLFPYFQDDLWQYVNLIHLALF